MSTSTKLSIIILNHRADHMLERSLQSAQFADDVLIIDNNSNADWQGLGAHYQFRVVPYPNQLTDWSAVRNFALSAATHDWVFFLDSDEVLNPSSVPLIRQMISSPVYAGYYVKRTDVFHDKHLQFGEAGIMPLLRMGKKSEMKFERPVHEEATVSGPTVFSDVTIRHYSHQSITDFLTKITTYAKHEADYRFAQNKSLFLPSLIGYPIAKFFLNYFFKLGFRDGWHGLVYAFMMSLHSFFVRVYLYERKHSASQTI